MGSRRMVVGLLLAAAVALVAALPAAAKEGVKATLSTAIPLDETAGTHLKVSWSLAYRDEHGRLRPFGANAVFVRLLSSTGAGARTSYAPMGDYSDGRYTAAVVVPDGGIRDVQIGLRGFTSGANGTRNADMLFPITNDPLPGVASVVTRSGSDWTRWVLVGVFAASFLAVALLGVGLVRRRAPGALTRG